MRKTNDPQTTGDRLRNAGNHKKTAGKRKRIWVKCYDCGHRHQVDKVALSRRGRICCSRCGGPVDYQCDNN